MTCLKISVLFWKGSVLKIYVAGLVLSYRD